MGMGVMKVGAAAAIVLLFGIIHLAAPGFLPALFALLSTGDISATVEYIRGYGDWAAVFAFFLTLFVNALGFPPAIIFSTANVMLFGIVPGIILSCAAETVGVTDTLPFPTVPVRNPSLSGSPTLPDPVPVAGPSPSQAARRA